MKNRIIKISVLAVVALASFVSCKDTWLMYNLSQKDNLYFKEKDQKHTYSFALIEADTINVSTTVYIMGQVSDVDRHYSVEYLDAEPGDSLLELPVVSAVAGEDFEVGDLVIPAGDTSAVLNIKLKRTAKMLDSCYVRVGIRLKADE